MGNLPEIKNLVSCILYLVKVQYPNKFNMHTIKLTNRET